MLGLPRRHDLNKILSTTRSDYAMTVANGVVVIYATRSKILRRKIILDDESQLDRHQPGPGESLLLLPLSSPVDDASCRAAIAAATGTEPSAGRCCIIDAGGNVVGVCNADPALDTHPAGRLIAHDTAGFGDRYEGGVFKRKDTIADNATRKGSRLTPLPLDNPLAFEASSLAPTSRNEIGDTVCRKDVASARP
jgi:hypothetical protein